MDSDRIISGIIIAAIVTVASFFLKPFLLELPVVGAILKGAASDAGHAVVEGVLPPSTGRPKNPCANAADHRKSAEDSAQREAYVDRLERFPLCDFATMAKMRIRELDTGQGRRRAMEEAARRQAEEENRRTQEEARRRADIEARRRDAEEAQRRATDEARRRADAQAWARQSQSRPQRPIDPSSIGGVIPCSADDKSFIPGRGWVPNCGR
jgi:hypothetical protein